MMHTHTFTRHVGIGVFGGTGMAWVPAIHVSNALNLERPEMWRCSECGEQGYEVR